MFLSTEHAFGSSREELADLVRLRRSALTCAEVGIEPKGRRRTPGLRREEVAELAGISYAMYVAIEQARAIPVSVKTIEAIARALKFTESEQLHARRLVQRPRSHLREMVSPKLERFVTCNNTPMYVLNHVWEIILANEAAVALFGLSGSYSPVQNALAHAYLEPRNRLLFDSWRTMARSSLEAFRLEVACPPVDPRAVKLVERLLSESSEFAQDWKEHRVREHPKDVYRLNHPMCGQLSMEPSAYAVLESPGLRMMAFTLTDAESVDKLRSLVALRRTPLASSGVD